MTYRERRMARAERLRGWADGRAAKAEAEWQRSHDIASGIPFGQPILVGHHSEGRHRRDVRRIEDGMRASIDNARKADSMRSRADNIEAQADRAIYDDDPDAVERLTERIAELEAERDRIKAYNASCRKGQRDVTLLDERQQQDLVTIARVCSYQLGKQGQLPGYSTTNLSANIRRYKQRLERLQRPVTTSSFRQLSARYPGECDGCGAAVERGETIFYSRRAPRGERLFCESCNPTGRGK